MSRTLAIPEVMGDAAINIAFDTIAREKQALFFLNSKRNAESLAERIAAKIKEAQPNNDVLAKKALHLPKPTKQCQRLALVLKKGMAFHHAGLTSQQRELIEQGFREGNIKIICATPTLCLHKDALIWQGLTEKKVCEIKKGNMVYALKEKAVIKVPVSAIHKNTATGYLTITSVSGHSVTVTPNHRVLIKRNGEVKLIQVRDCKKTDYIATLGLLSVSSKNVRLSRLVRDNQLPFSDKLLDPNDYYLIGSMLGDGYSGAEYRGKKIIYKGSPCIVGNDQEIFARIKDKCAQYDLLCKADKNYHGTNQLILSKKKWFREFLCRAGIQIREQKHICVSLLGAPESCVRALLQGLFDTDGYVQQYRNVGFSNISCVLVRQMQRLLLRWGIVTRFRQRKPGKMKMYGKEYLTKIGYELTIVHKLSILKFNECVGFSVERKKKSLQVIVANIMDNIHYAHCPICKYRIYADLFTGRTKEQQLWGKQKHTILSFLGRYGELASNEIIKRLGIEPRKKDRRLNHHYQLITKRKKGVISKTEWYWSLNAIGSYLYKHDLFNNLTLFFKRTHCPLCGTELMMRLKSGWRTKDIDGDIFWDKIHSLEPTFVKEESYDVVLSTDRSNDHLFVANGIFVHNSAGVDLPAFRAVIRDVQRYGKHGMQHIPVLEYEQMAGRAGRPGKDDHGEAILIAASEKDKQLLKEAYVDGETESIYSKLAVEPILRTYCLSLIATNYVKDENELKTFFAKTFYAHQYGDLKKLAKLLDKTIARLQEWQFLHNSKDDFVGADQLLRKETALAATLFGKRTSELYLDPYTARFLLDCILTTRKRTPSVFSYLHVLCSCLEMRPLLRVKVADMDTLQAKITLHSEELLVKEPSYYDEEYDAFLQSCKTALFFMDWINEMNEDDLLNTYDVRPGEIRAKLDIADWLLYAMEELARISKNLGVIADVRKLRVRLKHGAREELLPLLKLKGIGRVRARLLFKNGVKDIGGVKEASTTTLGQLLGKAIAEDIKKQVGEDIPEEVSPRKRKGQMSMDKYE
ncbi:MAG: LAGLIDADG family homing endonuclease [archaeon]